MNTQVTEDNYIQVVQDLRDLVHLHHNIIINLEDALIKLRRHTWPYIQSKKETKPSDRMDEKSLFFKYIDDEETKKLLIQKSKFRPQRQVYTRETLEAEFSAIKKYVPKQSIV